MRRIFEISGEDRIGFLNGLITQDVPDAGLGYAALLTPQGKYLSDFFLWQNGESVFLDVAEIQADDLMRRLTMYRLRAKVEISESALSVSRGTGSMPEGALSDPRDAAMGWHLYGDGSHSDSTDWDALRVAHVIPEAGAELIVGESYILEHGFERLNGVDFRKGCFVGQEIVARMKHKTTLRKGLVQVRIDGPAEPGAEITAGGKSVGTLHTISGDKALAYVRFDRMTGEMRAGEALVFAPENAH